MRKKFDILKLSAHFTVRNLNQEDAEIIYDLCRRNTLFYQYHPPFVTVESILEDMEALPPGKSYQDKHYIGFLRDAELVAVMDLIEDYPHMGNAWIGFFAMNTLYQGKGIGTSIISDCASYLGQIGFDQVRLGVDKGNPQSKAFWTKNHFALTGEEFPSDTPSYLMMERKL